MTDVDEVREFNRFYTRQIGLLGEHLPASDLSLPEARVLYELARAGERTAAEMVRLLRMDKAHLSRILARFRVRGLIHSRVSPEHAKRRLLRLTEAGRRTFAALDQGTRAAMEDVLSPLDPDARQRLLGAMREIRGVFGAEARRAGIRLRSVAPGDLGWITHRQGLLYQREYGWDWTYEGLVCDILGKFVANFDCKREDAWIAERAGAIVGSIFLMKSEAEETARLRLLYVEPSARGLGIGRTLVDVCIERARELRYRRITLWTNDVLVAARRIYQAVGFQLSEERAHHSFGHRLVGQTWTLDLTPPATAAAGTQPKSDRTPKRGKNHGAC
jgi:DNA-binding MarR family transcriptional regulator/N-acetylglutamate synthase-like GNAT family acetyltransferase